ncbi:MAG: hypothetical protein R2695_02540 [Acidimicrobiales bacterium]
MRRAARTAMPRRSTSCAMDDVLHTEVDGEVALVVLNRPARRNALNPLLVGGLRATLKALD